MKRAMSPLFSTIVLIGFAVALGGVVMSWGRAGYVEEEVVGCEKISLMLVSYGENEGICNKENRLYFTVQNNGEIKLDGVKVSILGSEIYTGVIDKEINVADVVKLDIGYSDVGKIEKVIFVPKFIESEEERFCAKNGFEIDEVEEC